MVEIYKRTIGQPAWICPIPAPLHHITFKLDNNYSSQNCLSLYLCAHIHKQFVNINIDTPHDSMCLTVAIVAMAGIHSMQMHWTITRYGVRALALQREHYFHNIFANMHHHGWINVSKNLVYQQNFIEIANFWLGTSLACSQKKLTHKF